MNECMNECMYVRTCMYVLRIRTYVCTYVGPMYVCIHVCMYCLYTCMYCMCPSNILAVHVLATQRLCDYGIMGDSTFSAEY